MNPLLKYYLRRILSLPPHQVAKKAVRLARELIRQRIEAARERRASTYCHVDESRPLSRRIHLTAADIPDDLRASLPKVAERYLGHQFDLLGSGWVEIRHGADCNGLEQHKYPARPNVRVDAQGSWLSAIVNDANRKQAARDWRLLSNSSYQPIDWHLDFRSGYRWSAKNRFNEQSIGFPPGSDIKMPWELARMQHLPQLAVAALLASSEQEGWREARIYIDEIRNEIIDFYCGNPPRFGPNWTCPMDVGIRAANWVVALDIASNIGWRPDERFHRLLVDSLYDHGRHILAHLEWSESGRSNHYLSDIVGLLFIAAYLPPTAETQSWLAFATSELIAETERQFHEDGGNYEGSTSYHRLSGELAIFGCALVAGLASEGHPAFESFDATYLESVRPPVPLAPLAQFETGVRSPVSPAAVERLAGIGRFARAVLRPDNNIVQVGDTDSGRFLKLHPMWGDGDEEDMLDPRHLISAVDALFGNAPRHEWFDGAVIRSLMNGATFQAPNAPAAPTVSTSSALLTAIDRVKALSPEAQRVVSFNVTNLPAQRTLSHFPDFGLVVVKGEGFFLSLRCAESYRADAPTGHLHDDNLSLEIFADGTLLASDPGTYVYTSNPDARNLYRSAAAHFVSRAAEWDATAIEPGLLFQCPSARSAKLIYAGIDGLAAEMWGPNGQVLIRVIEIADRVLIIRDGVEKGILRPLSISPPYSHGYGKVGAQS